MMLNFIARLWQRTVALSRRTDDERELTQELEFHLAMKQREKEQLGMAALDAQVQARQEMGNLTQAKENSRETWMFLRIETLSNDIRYACRVLLKAPVFTICAVLTLAFGIGANTAIFTLVDALLLRGLPVPQPERMTQLTVKGAEEMTSLTYPLFEDIKNRVHSFSGIFSWNASDLWIGRGSQARRVNGVAASGGAYLTLGLIPQAGRLFTPADDVEGDSLVAVISDRFWEREFHRDPNAIGQTLWLNRKPFLMIGVTAHNFLGVIAGDNPDVTIPVHANAALHPSWHILDSKTSWYVLVFGRLKAGVSEAQARVELSTISSAIMRNQVTEDTPLKRQQFLAQKLNLIPGAAGGSWLAKRYRRSLLLLMCISGLVLLLACVNLASLSLSRVAPRQKELSVRLALGAKRGRLIQQLLTEAVIISIVGGALGIAFAFWATRGLVAFLLTQGSPLVLNLNPDWRILAFLGILTTCTGLLFGAAPAFQGTNLHPIDALKQTTIELGRSSHHFPLGKALVAVQVALSVVLLTGAMLFVETLEKLKWQDTGFDRNHVMFLELNADNAGLKDDQLASVYDGLLAGVHRNALVRSASLTNVIPVSGSYEYEDLKPELWPHVSAKERMLYVHRVAPEYFETLGIRFLRGRDFLLTEPASSSVQPGILSASAAHIYFPNRDPIGQLLRQDEKAAYRIIGVVDDAKYVNLRDKSPTTIYLEIKGSPFCNLVIRGELSKSAAMSDVRNLLKQTGKDVRLGETVMLTEQIDETLVSERLIALLASFFALLAAALVAIGLYGIVNYTAACRTSEMGVRLALGATGKQILWLVMREAIVLSIIGAAVGIPVTLLCGRLITSMLYGVSPNNPFLLTSTVVLLLIVAVIAGFLPAARTARLDPMWALRYE